MMKFYDTKGRLTAYALACGYVERKHNGSVQTTLWAEHGVYHVRAHDFEAHTRVFWDTFDRLGEAQKRFAN